MDMEQEHENYEEKISVPVYDTDLHPEWDVFNASSENHYYTSEKIFEYKDILAISSKKYGGTQYNCSRGGALIFVKNRKTPYVTRDDYSVKKIIKELNKNPLACLSGLNQVGPKRIYATEYKIEESDIILPNGAILWLSGDGLRVLKLNHYVMTKKGKKSHFHETKKEQKKKQQQK